MECPNCGIPLYGGSEVCGRCGARVDGAAELGMPAPGRAARQEGEGAPDAKAGPQAADKPGEAAATLTPGQYLLMLFLGLLPLVGIFYSVAYAFGKQPNPERRSLAKAMLWVHGVGMGLVLVGLCMWVLGLAVRLG